MEFLGSVYITERGMYYDVIRIDGKLYTGYDARFYPECNYTIRELEEDEEVNDLVELGFLDSGKII